MPPPPTTLRLLVVLPSWVGDAAMATPALRLIRDRLPGAFIGALCRPGIDRIIAGSDFFDEVHVYQPHGVLAPRRAATKVRGRRYDTALLLTNSFSTALITRLAFIPRRVGYDRDARGLLLSDRLEPLKNKDGSWRIVPAVNAYWHAACALLGLESPGIDTGASTSNTHAPLILPPGARMELAVTDQDEADARDTLRAAGFGPHGPTQSAPDHPFAILNPGGNNPAKRWPTERFAEVAQHLSRAHNLSILINGSPAEADLCNEIAQRAATVRERSSIFSLPAHHHTLGGLKALCARARLMLTNDTGPRHLAAGFGTPAVSLFGPTDPRWTTIPHDREAILVADPTLPPDQSANDHPDRCRIDRIEVSEVIAACDQMLDSEN